MLSKKPWIYLTVIASISPLIFGYYFGFLDHHHYLPYLNKLLDPNLYPLDYYFSQPHGLYSPFNYLLVGFTKLFNTDLAITHFVFYLLTLWLLYFGIYKLSLAIYGKKIIGYLAIFLLIVPKWAAQIGYMTHHFYFVSRDLSLGLSLIALSNIFSHKKWISGLWLAAATIVNLSIPIPVAIFWLIRFINLKRIVPSVVVMPSAWIETLKTRGTYSFPHLWQWTGWGNMLLWFSLFVPGYLLFKEKIFGRLLRPVRLFLFICLGLFIGHSLIALIWPNPWLIQLQLLRSVNFIFVIAAVSFAAAGYQLLERGSIFAKVITIISLIGVYSWGDHLAPWHFIIIWLLPAYLLMIRPVLGKVTHPRLAILVILVTLTANLFFKLAVVRPEIKWPYYWHYPNALIEINNFDTWLELQSWAKNNTPIESVFLTPQDLIGFRSFSQRGIVADAKDGGVAFYSPLYAASWQQRMDDLSDYDGFNETDFLKLKLRYQFDFLIVKSSHQLLGLEKVFENADFVIYKI